MRAAASWRLLDTGAREAAWNMALDEVLFTRFIGRPVLRVYGWDPPALSIGYFQSIGEFEPDPVDTLGLPVVRRLTGGGAIWHEDELTYSVAAGRGQTPFAFRGAEAYRMFHSAIIAALARLRVEACECGPGALDSDAGDTKYCFARSVPFDVAAGGRKIAGSAQRRRGGRLLMHGSVFLGSNRMVPRAASVSELAGRKIACREFADVFVACTEEILGVRLKKDALTREEETLAARLARDKYAADSWTRKR